jgi:formate hydrogenlyase subunit 3/multisubunit Na+/H+ antiporter MnhD subunit
VPRSHTFEDSLPKRMEYSIYVLSLKEWNLDSFMYHYLWNPVKWLGKKLGMLNTTKVLVFFIPVYALGLYFLVNAELFPFDVHRYLPVIFSVIGVMMVLKSFTERIHARMSWILVILNHFWVALAVNFNEQFEVMHTLLYLSGVSAFGLVGYLALRRLKYLEGSIDMDRFHGHSYKHPKIALVFLLSCLGVSGFPITPTFVGEDLIFSHIHEDQIALAFLTSLSFIVDGLAIIRIYARVFLGPHSRSVYEMAYRSS